MRMTTRILTIALLFSGFVLLPGCGTWMNGERNPEYYEDEVTEAHARDNYRQHHKKNKRRHSRSRSYYSRPARTRGPGYHMHGRSSPASHKDRDVNWVKRQDGYGYTIQVSKDSSAAKVAKTLHTAPKDSRMAQYPYYKNGKKVYGGVYGTYRTREEAEAAMKKLPASMRNKANVKQWDKVQKKIDKPAAPSGETSYRAPVRFEAQDSQVSGDN